MGEGRIQDMKRGKIARSRDDTKGEVKQGPGFIGCSSIRVGG